MDTVEQCRKECYTARFRGDACATYNHGLGGHGVRFCRLRTASMSGETQFSNFWVYGIMEPGMYIMHKTRIKS